MPEENCIFCQIIAEKEPAVFHYKSKEFVVFENNLRWFPVQLLVVPTKHMMQSDLWSDSELVSNLCTMANTLWAPRNAIPATCPHTFDRW